jgi:hypothetical protein
MNARPEVAVRVVALLALALAANVLAIVPTASAAFFYFREGKNDIFALPTDAATPSAGLTIPYTAFLPFQNYDEPGNTGQLFLETFDGLPKCMLTANLAVRMRPAVGGQSNNDAISLMFINNVGAPAGPSYTQFIGNPQSINNVLSPPWTIANYPGGVYTVFDVSSLPIAMGQSFVNLLPTLKQLRYLDILIQNDTNVDYLEFYCTTELAGDMTGDGMVDNADLLLLAANFNQPLQPGVGDPNSDGFIDLADLVIVQAQFGMMCPEPASVTLLALAGGVWMGRTRRRRV